MWSSPRDNWERLVAAVLKKDEIWQLCHQDSITTVSSNTHRPSNSNSSGEILSISSSRSRRISLSSPRQTLHTSASDYEATNNTFGIPKLFSALLLLGRRKPKGCDLGQENNFGLSIFSLRELRVATDNFSNKNVLGHGGNSTVYKCRLGDGSLVVVKRLTRELIEMGKELEIASIAAHHNVIHARGFCITEKERLLVYRYMVNGSVASCLRERQEPLPPLDWPVRKRIAVGAAKGLAYLHYDCPRKIIHCDVKAANIFLDEDLEAVVSDFNLAEFVDCYKDDGVKGGYKERKWKAMVDTELQSDLVIEEVEMLLQIALICTQTDPEGRPTMMEVVRMLEVGYGLAERWEKWYKEEFDAEYSGLRYLRRFTIHELQAATGDFSDRVISKDGFNMIYKGWLDGSPVAVKRYNSRNLEYYLEKELDIGRIHLHRRLVHVIGFCQTLKERLLVFRLMADQSVESWLSGRHEIGPDLTWQRRKEIALSGVTGSAYLLEKWGKKITYHDFRASTILLDDNFEVAFAYFGMVKFMAKIIVGLMFNIFKFEK